jgi:hypothetical protein
LLKILIISFGWFKTKIIVNNKIKRVNKLTNLKLFLIKTPTINKNIIDKDKNNSGKI